MPLDRLLEEATSPADAAEAAQLMAAATVDDTDATEQERSDARDILALSWDELIGRFSPNTHSSPPPSVQPDDDDDDDDVWSDVVPSRVADDDGSMTTVNPDGSITTVNPDGTKGTAWVEVKSQEVRILGRRPLPKGLHQDGPAVSKGLRQAGHPVPKGIRVGGRKEVAAFVSSREVLSTEELRRIKMSLPEGVELAIVHDAPLRSDDPDQT